MNVYGWGGLVDFSEIIPVSDFRAEIRELEDPEEIQLLHKVIFEGYERASLESKINLANLCRAIGDMGDERFLAFVEGQTNTRWPLVRTVAKTTLLRLQLAAIPASARVQRLGELVGWGKGPVDDVQAIELVRAIALEGERGVTYLCDEYRRQLTASPRNRQMLGLARIGMVLTEVEDAIQIIEGNFRALQKPMQCVLGGDLAMCYWRIKTKGLDVSERTKALIPRLALCGDGLRHEYGMGAYRYLRHFGAKSVSEIERTALSRETPLSVRRGCIDILFDLGIEGAMKRLVKRVNDGDELPEITKLVNWWLSRYELLKPLREKRRRFEKFMGPPVFKISG